MVQIPDYFPDWLTAMVLGHFPEGDPEAMRRSADTWSDAANGLVLVLHRLQPAVEQLEKAVEGETGTEVQKQYRKIIDQIQAQIEFNNAMARQLYDNATAIEYQQYVLIGIAGALLAQVIIDMAMPPPGSIVKAIADRAEARVGMELAQRDLVLTMLTRAARFVSEHPRLVLASKGVFFGTAIGGGVPYVAQRVQIAQGHRKVVDWQQVRIGAAAGAVGGLVGVEVGRRVAPAAMRAGGRVLGTVAAGGVGGMAGGLAGGLTAFALTKGELRGKDLATMVWTGLGTGLVGSLGASVRAARAGAYTGVPEPVASADSGPPSDAAPSARISAPGDGQPPQTQSATPEPVSTTSEVDAPQARRPGPESGDGSMDRPDDLTPEMMAEGDQILRDMVDDALARIMGGDGPGQLPDGSGGTTPGIAPDYPSGGSSHPSSRGGGTGWPAWDTAQPARGGVAVAAHPEGGPVTPLPARQFQISDPQVRPDQQGINVITEGAVTQPDIAPGTEVLFDDGSSAYAPIAIEHGPAGEMYLLAPEQTAGQDMTGPRPSGESLGQGATTHEAHPLLKVDFDAEIAALEAELAQTSQPASADTTVPSVEAPMQAVDAPPAPATHTATDDLVAGHAQSISDSVPAVSAGTGTQIPGAQASAAIPKADPAQAGYASATAEPRNPVVPSNATNSATPSAAAPTAASSTSHTGGPKPPLGPTPPSGSQSTGPLAGPTPGAHGPATHTNAPPTSASATPQTSSTPPPPIASAVRPGTDDEPDAHPEEFPTPPGTGVDDPREHNVQKDPREHSVQQDPRDHNVQKKPAGDYVTIPGVSYPLEDEPPENAIPVIPRTPALTPLPADSVDLGRAFQNRDDTENSPGPTSPRAPDIADPLSDRHPAAPETNLDVGLGKAPDSFVIPTRYATEPSPEAPGAPQKPTPPRLNPHHLGYLEHPSDLPAVGGVPHLQPASQPKKKIERKRLVTRMGADPDDNPRRRKRTRKQQSPPPPPAPESPQPTPESPAPTPASQTKSRKRSQPSPPLAHEEFVVRRSGEAVGEIGEEGERVAPARNVRRWVTSLQQRFPWLTDDQITTAKLLVSEMAANSLRWTQGGVTAIATATDTGDTRRTRFTVTDESAVVPERTGMPDSDAERGRGGEFVVLLSDDHGTTVQDNGKSTWFELHRPRPDSSQMDNPPSGARPPAPVAEPISAAATPGDTPRPGRMVPTYPVDIDAILTQIDDAGSDAETTARAKNVVLQQFRDHAQAREHTLHKEFLTNKEADLVSKRVEDAVPAARRQADDFIRSDRARDQITRYAAQRTTEWLNKNGIHQLLQAARSHPPASGTADEVALELSRDSAASSASHNSPRWPEALQETLRQIDSAGRDPVVTEQAKALVIQRYREYQRAPEEGVYRKFLETRTAEYSAQGIPLADAVRSARQDADAYMETPKARRMIDSPAANNTNQWVDKVRSRADRENSSLVDQLAGIYRDERQVTSDIVPLRTTDQRTSSADSSEQNTAVSRPSGASDVNPPTPEPTPASEVDTAMLPAAIQDILTRLADPGRMEIRVLERYQVYLLARERSLYREYLEDARAALIARSTPSETVEPLALRHANEMIGTDHARDQITAAAVRNTQQWVQRSRIHLRPDDVTATRPAPSEPHQNAESTAGTSPFVADPRIPRAIREIIARIEDSGADRVVIEQARELILERYRNNFEGPQNGLHRETVLQRTQALRRKGMPRTEAERQARRAADDYMQTAKARRIVAERVAHTTSQWLNSFRERAERADSNFVDRLARLYRDEHRIPSAPLPGLSAEQRTVIDRLDALLRDLTEVEDQYAALLERMPDLATRGANRWLHVFRVHRSTLAEMAAASFEGKTATGQPITSDVDMGSITGHASTIRGFRGELQLAAQFDHVDAVCLIVETRMPMGPRIQAEIDVVTDGSRVWREAKTNRTKGQFSKVEEFEAQARRQLHVSYLNRAYWVDDSPPEIKWHFMNGVDPRVKLRLEAIRIEDETGRIIPDHSVEVIDGSKVAAGPTSKQSAAQPQVERQSARPGAADTVATSQQAQEGDPAALQAQRERYQARRVQYGETVFRYLLQVLGISTAPGGRAIEPKVRLAQEVNRDVFRYAEAEDWSVPPDVDVREWLQDVAHDVLADKRFHRIRRGALAVLRGTGLSEGDLEYRVLAQMSREQFEFGMADLSAVQRTWLQRRFELGSDRAEVAAIRPFNSYGLEALVNLEQVAVTRLAQSIATQTGAHPEERDEHTAPEGGAPERGRPVEESEPTARTEEEDRLAEQAPDARASVFQLGTDAIPIPGSEQYAELLATVEAQVPPTVRVAMSADLGALVEAIQALRTENMRRYAELHYLNGLSWTETAQVMGISRGTIRRLDNQVPQSLVDWLSRGPVFRVGLDELPLPGSSRYAELRAAVETRAPTEVVEAMDGDLAALLGAVERLPTDERRYSELAYFGALRRSEISDVMGQLSAYKIDKLANAAARAVEAELRGDSVQPPPASVREAVAARLGVDPAESIPDSSVVNRLRAELDVARSELAVLLGMDTDLVRHSWVRQAVRIVEEQLAGLSAEDLAAAVHAGRLPEIGQWVGRRLQFDHDVQTATVFAIGNGAIEPDARDRLHRRGAELDRELAHLLALSELRPITDGAAVEPLTEFRRIAEGTNSSAIGELVGAIASFLDSYDAAALIRYAEHDNSTENHTFRLPAAGESGASVLVMPSMPAAAERDNDRARPRGTLGPEQARVLQIELADALGIDPAYLRSGLVRQAIEIASEQVRNLDQDAWRQAIAGGRLPDLARWIGHRIVLDADIQAETARAIDAERVDSEAQHRLRLRDEELGHELAQLLGSPGRGPLRQQTTGDLFTELRRIAAATGAAGVDRLIEVAQRYLELGTDEVTGHIERQKRSGGGGQPAGPVVSFQPGDPFAAERPRKPHRRLSRGFTDDGLDLGVFNYRNPVTGQLSGMDEPEEPPNHSHANSDETTPSTDPSDAPVESAPRQHSAGRPIGNPDHLPTATRAAPSKPRYETAEPGFPPDSDDHWMKPIEVVILDTDENDLFIGPDGKPYNTRARGGDTFLLTDTGKWVTTRTESAEHPHLYNSYLRTEGDNPPRKSVFSGFGYWIIINGRPTLAGPFSGLFLAASRQPKYLAQLWFALSQHVEISTIQFKHLTEIQGRLWWDAPETQGEYSAAEIVPGAGFIGSRNGLERRISALIPGAGDDFWVEVAGVHIPANGGLRVDITLNPVRGEPGLVALEKTAAADTATAWLRDFDPGPEPHRTYPILQALYDKLSPWLAQSHFSWAPGTEQVLTPGSPTHAVHAAEQSVRGTVVVREIGRLPGENRTSVGGLVTAVAPESGPDRLVLQAVEARGPAHAALAKTVGSPWLISVETEGYTAQCNIRWRIHDDGRLHGFVSFEDPDVQNPHFDKVRELIDAALLDRFPDRVIDLVEDFDGKIPAVQRDLGAKTAPQYPRAMGAPTPWSSQKPSTRSSTPADSPRRRKTPWQRTDGELSTGKRTVASERVDQERKPATAPRTGLIGGVPDLVNPFDDRGPAWERGGRVPRHKRMERLAEAHADGGGFARGGRPEPKHTAGRDEPGQLGGQEPSGKPETQAHDSAENEPTAPKPSSAPDFRDAEYADLRAWAAGLSDEDASSLLDRLHADATAHLDALERGTPPPGSEVVATARALSIVMWEQSHRLRAETHSGPIHDYATLFAVSRQLAAQLPTVRELYAAANTVFTVAGALALDAAGTAEAHRSTVVQDFTFMHSLPEHLGRSVDKIERSFGSVPWSAESSFTPRSAADPEHRGPTTAAIDQVQGLLLHFETVRETSGTDWSEFVDEYLTSRSEIGFDPELTRSMASLSAEAEAFARARTGSEPDFAVAAAPYLADLTAVATHYLTRSRDTGLALDLLSEARRAFTAIAERLPHWEPAQHAARTMTLLQGTITAAHPELPTHEHSRMMRSWALIWLAEPTGFSRSLDQTLQELRRLGTSSTTVNAPDLPFDDNRPPRMVSASEFAAQLAEAERSGPPLRTAPAHMFTQNSVTELLTYPNGFLAVEKSALSRTARAAEILASAVGHAMDAPVPPVLPVEGDDHAIRMPWLPGITVPGTMEDPGAISAMEALLGHPDAEQLGLLDVAINNWDRQSNWMRDGDRVYGYDHAFAFRAPVDPSSSPFSRRYVSDLVADREEDPYVWVLNHRSRSQLDTYRRNVEALLPLFEEYEFPEWHPGVVTRLRRAADHADDSAPVDQERALSRAADGDSAAARTRDASGRADGPGDSADSGRDVGPDAVSALDLVSVTSAQLIELLDSGRITSVQLTQLCLHRIEALSALNAVIGINPHALEEAARADELRRTGAAHGPLLGVPVLIKGNIDIAGMPTTAGSVALANSYPAANAALVTQLREAGAVILGHSNLTEFGSYLSSTLPYGYSSYGGQTLNPIDVSLVPGGSSSGSAVGVAAGLAPLAIGSQASGSITTPSNWNSIVGLKPTVGAVPRVGAVPMSTTRDSPGAHSPDVTGAAVLLTALVGVDPRDPATANNPLAGHDFTVDLNPEALRGARIGVLTLGIEPEGTQKRRLWDAALTTLKARGATLITVDLDTSHSFQDDNPPWSSVFSYEMKRDLNTYLSQLPADAPMKDLADIIAFNDAHPETALKYGQDLLIAAQAKDIGADSADTAKYQADLQLDLTESKTRIDAVMAEHELTALVSVYEYGTIMGDKAGYPCIIVPAGRTPATPDHPAGEHVNVTFRAAAWSEPTLIGYAYAFEQAHAVPRPRPQFADQLYHQVTAENEEPAVAAEAESSGVSGENALRESHESRTPTTDAEPKDSANPREGSEPRQATRSVGLIGHVNVPPWNDIGGADAFSDGGPSALGTPRQMRKRLRELGELHIDGGGWVSGGGQGRHSRMDPDEAAVAAVRDLPADPGDLNPDLTVEFVPLYAPDGLRTEEDLEAVAMAVADMMRERGWRDRGQIEAATELVRGAGRNAMTYMERYTRSLQRRGIEWYEEQTAVQDMKARLTLRMSTQADARSLYVSFDVDQYRPQRSPDIEMFTWHAPLFSHAEIGTEVRELLDPATVSGVEQWGEVWARFDEPRSEPSGDSVVDPPPRGALEAKARIVRKLYDDHRIRFRGWEDSVVPVRAVESVDRALRDLIAEYGGRFALRYFRFDDEIEGFGLTQSFGTTTPDTRDYYVTVTLNSKILTDPEFARAWAEQTADHRWAESAEDMIYQLTHHEFIHVVADEGNWVLHHLAPAMLRAAYELYRELDLIAADVGYTEWLAQLPHYSLLTFTDPVTNTFDPVEGVAEGARAGAVESSLPLTHPARVLHWLTVTRDGSSPAEFLARWAQRQASGDPDISLLLQDFRDVTGRDDIAIPSRLRPGDTTVDVLAAATGGQPQHFADAAEIEARLRTWDESSGNRGDGVSALVVLPEQDPYLLVRRASPDGTTRIELRSPVEGVLRANHVPSAEAPGPHGAQGMFFDETGAAITAPLGSESGQEGGHHEARDQPGDRSAAEESVRTTVGEAAPQWPTAAANHPETTSRQPHATAQQTDPFDSHRVSGTGPAGMALDIPERKAWDIGTVPPARRRFDPGMVHAVDPRLGPDAWAVGRRGRRPQRPPAAPEPAGNASGSLPAAQSSPRGDEIETTDHHENGSRPAGQSGARENTGGGVRITPAGLIVPADPTNSLIVPAAHVMPADPSLEELMERLRPWKEIFSYFWKFPLPREGEPSGREWIESSERKAWMRRRAIRRTPLYAGVDAAVRLTLGAERLLMAPNATPGPATIQQRRVIPGRGEIDAEKKRTMHADAEVREANRADVEQMTPFEKFWRRVSGDELPQTKQIRQGELAYVGGRLLRAEGHNLMVAGRYAEGYNLMVSGRDPVHALWLMFSHDALWTVHYPGCRELEPQSPDFLLTRYLTVAIFDKIASKPLEVQYLDDVVRPYLRRQGVAAGRVLIHELSHHLPNSCRSTMEQLGVWALRGLGRKVGAEVEEHLDNCAACRNSASTLPSVDSSLGGRKLLVPPGPAGDGATRRPPTAAATDTRTPPPRAGTPPDHARATPAQQLDKRVAVDPAVVLDLPPQRARGLDGVGFDPPSVVANRLGGVPRGLPDGVVAHAANADDPHGGAFGGGRSEAERIANAALSTFRVDATFDHLQNWAARLSDNALQHLLTGFTHRVAAQLAAIHRGKASFVTDRVTNPARLLGAIVTEAAGRFGDSVPTDTPTTYRELFALGSWLRANRSTVADLHAGMTAVLDATFAVVRTVPAHRWSLDAVHHTVPAHLQEIAHRVEEAERHRIWLEEDAFPPEAALDAEHMRFAESVGLGEMRDTMTARMVTEWAGVMNTLLQQRSGETFSPRYATIFESLPVHALALDRARSGSDRLFAATAATALPHLLDAAFYLLPTSNFALGLDYLRQADDLLTEATTRFTNHIVIYSLQDAAENVHKLYEDIIAADSRRSTEVRAQRIHEALSDFFGIGSESPLHRSFLWGVRALWGLGSQSPGIDYATRGHRLDPVLPWDWDITDDERALAATAADLLRTLRGPEAGIPSLLRHSGSPDLVEDTFDSVSKNMRWWGKLRRWTSGTTPIGSLLAGATDFSVSQMQLAVLRQYPHIIGAAPGIEYRARDLANRLSLARDLESPGLAPEIRHELAALRDQLAEARHGAFGLAIPGSGRPPVLLIFYDPIAEGGTGGAVVSIGEADSASFMAFNVIGTDTLLTDLSNWAVRACRQYEEAQQHAPRDTRVAIMFTVGIPRGIGAPSHAAEPDTSGIDNVVEARDVAGEIVARELLAYDATRELALDDSDDSLYRMVRLSTAIGHGDGVGVLRAAAQTLWLSRAVDQIVLVPGSAGDPLPTADQLNIGTEHVYTLNPHRDRNGDPNTIARIMVGHGADIESAPDASSRSAAPLIETPTTIRDLSQLLSAHEYRPLGGRRGIAMTHDEGLTVYLAAQPLLRDALSGTYNTTVILEELGLVLRIGQPDTGSYDPRFGPEHSTLPVISRYVRNSPQLLRVVTGRMPDGRVIDESAPILVERLARGDNLTETFRRADRRTIRFRQGLILRAFANIHEQLRAMPEDHPLLDQLTPPGVAKGDTGGWYLNHIDWYTKNFYLRHYARFGHLFDEFGLLRGNPFEPLIDEGRTMRESRHHILHADPNAGNFLISNELHVTLLDWELAVTGPSAYDWARLGHLIPGIEVPRELGGPDMVGFARLEKFKRVMNDTVKLAPLAAAGQLTPQLIEFIDTEFSEAVIQMRQLSGHTDLLPPRAELEILRSWRP
ncbi:amidase family protein [Nocardia gamkensis]|uniref:amidase family protein n=1 Tax=Nocardia gamkensis TaxID=352869 RepID=UPI0036E0A86C